MPLPKRNKGQDKSDFLKICMENETMLKEYPDEKQRYAICIEQSLLSSSEEVGDEKKGIWD